MPAQWSKGGLSTGRRQCSCLAILLSAMQRSRSSLLSGTGTSTPTESSTSAGAVCCTEELFDRKLDCTSDIHKTSLWQNPRSFRGACHCRNSASILSTPTLPYSFNTYKVLSSKRSVDDILRSRLWNPRASSPFVACLQRGASCPRLLHGFLKETETY